jgi:hypothetical protein
MANPIRRVFPAAMVLAWFTSGVAHAGDSRCGRSGQIGVRDYMGRQINASLDSALQVDADDVLQVIILCQNAGRWESVFIRCLLFLPA